jgi:glycerophosphoryl diester phosphodiesterase
MQQQIIGHRGARDLWPENSLLGFRNTLGLGVDAVEFDVHPTRDGGLVVIHDATLDRTTNAQGPVAERCLAELRGLRLTGADEGVPSLAEVLDILTPSGLALHVELKADANGMPYEGLAENVLAELDRRGIAGSSILTSFDPAVLAHLRRLRPDLRLLASMNTASAQRHGGPEVLLGRFEALDVAHVAVEKTLLAERLDWFTARLPPSRLGVWVVNRPEDVARWIGAPVGFLTTDRPDHVLAARAASQSRSGDGQG